MVGLDTFVHVADNCFNSLVNDEERHVFEVPAYIRAMVEKKILGDKTKGGFYKRSKDGTIETLDPQTLTYRAKGGDEAIKKATKKAEKNEDPRARVRRSRPTRARPGSSRARCSTARSRTPRAASARSRTAWSRSMTR